MRISPTSTKAEIQDALATVSGLPVEEIELRKSLGEESKAANGLRGPAAYGATAIQLEVDSLVDDTLYVIHRLPPVSCEPGMHHAYVQAPHEVAPAVLSYALARDTLPRVIVAGEPRAVWDRVLVSS